MVDPTERVKLVIFHCQMFEYWHSLSFDITLEEAGASPIPRLFSQFAGLHLMFTMFLVDKGSDPMGGFCYRTLTSVGMADLLEPIQETLDEKLTDGITLGEFLRQSRNKLTTHGDLSFESLREDAQAVPFQETALDRFESLMETLGEQVRTLRETLAARL